MVTPDEKCMICRRKMRELTSLDTKWEMFGETVYMKCYNCNKIFAYPEDCYCTIQIKDSKIK